MKMLTSDEESTGPSNTQTSLPPTLKRSTSSTSVASTSEEFYTVAELVSRVKSQLTKLQNASTRKTCEKYFTNIQKILAAIEVTDRVSQKQTQDLLVKNAKLKERNGNLQERNEELRADLHTANKAGPTTTDIAAAVITAITELEREKEHRAGFLTVATPNALMEAQQPQPSPTPQPSNDNSKAAETQPKTVSGSKIQPADRLNRRTIVARGCSRMTGKQIDMQFTKHQIVIPVHAERVTLHRFHLEIQCKTESDKNILIRELQKNKHLNRVLTFVTQAPDQHKMILLGVPETVDREHLHAHFTANYAAHPDEVILLKDLVNKRDNKKKDWIILMPRELGKTIIAEGEMTIGLKSCPLRPHTSIQRCTNCQSYKHPTKFCKNDPHCVSCGQKHSKRQCEEKPSCINCKELNATENTDYDIRHKASDSRCPIYSFRYSQERERLDSIFIPSQNPPAFSNMATQQQQQQQHVSQQQRCPPPPFDWPYPGPWNWIPPWAISAFDQGGPQHRHSFGTSR